MPVYNEEECIRDVVNSWLGTLQGLGIDFQMIVINDGSRDNTIKSLEAFRDNPRIEVINKPNSGHGPTILMGYRIAVKKAEWVFQTDSDDEMKPEYFHLLWEKRDDYDALFGRREGRRQNLSRRIITLVSRLTIGLLYGKGVRDVNTPYRLMRSKFLSRIIDKLPDNIFAPNIIISGAFSRAHLRILNIPIPHLPRQTGKVSIIKLKLVKAAMKAFMQTMKYRVKIEA